MTKWSFTLERCYRYPSAKIGFGKLKKAVEDLWCGLVELELFSCSLLCLELKQQLKLNFTLCLFLLLKSADVESVENPTWKKSCCDFWLVAQFGLIGLWGL